MWSETTSPGDLYEPICDLARIRAVAFRLRLCKQANFLTPAVCIDHTKDFWPPRWFSPDTPATPEAMLLTRRWQPHTNKLLPAGRKYVYLGVDQYMETIIHRPTVKDMVVDDIGK